MRGTAQFWVGMAIGVVLTAGAASTLNMLHRPRPNASTMIATAIQAPSNAEQELAQSKEDLRQALALSADGARYDADALAQAAATMERQSGVDRLEAVSAAKLLVSKNIPPRLVKEYGFTIGTISKVAGRPLQVAADQIADGTTRGYEACRILDSDLNFLTADQATQLRHDFDVGDAEKARIACFQALHARAIKAAPVTY